MATEPRFRPPLGRAIIDILIILSAALTFVLEGGTVFGAPWALRSLSSLLCLCLDVFFLLELAVKSASAFADGRLRGYLGHGGGWRDGLAAILPLVFTSGPFLFGGLTGLASTATVTALGSFRLLRGLGLLRLLRLVRLFPSDIEEGRMTGATRAAALALAASLGVLIIAETASIAGLWPDAHAALEDKRAATLRALAQTPGADGSELIALADADLLLVRYQGRVVYTRYSAEEYHRRFGPDEIGYLRKGEDVEAFFSLTAELRAQAASTLASGLSGLAILMAVSWAGARQGKRRRLPFEDEIWPREEEMALQEPALEEPQEKPQEPMSAEELEALLGPEDFEIQDESGGP